MLDFGSLVLPWQRFGHPWEKTVPLKPREVGGNKEVPFSWDWRQAPSEAVGRTKQTHYDLAVRQALKVKDCRKRAQTLQLFRPRSPTNPTVIQTQEPYKLYSCSGPGVLQTLQMFRPRSPTNPTVVQAQEPYKPYSQLFNENMAKSINSQYFHTQLHCIFGTLEYTKN